VGIKVGLIGYGVGGRQFHAPYLRASEGCELVGIVTSSLDRARLAAEENPGARVFARYDELVAAGVDAVVVSTPPHTRRQLVLDAFGDGLHVMADKPFAPSAEVGRELADAADRAGVLLNVYHNRRYDTDIVTARSVAASGALGELRRLELRCDQDDPGIVQTGPDGGLLRDLGSHVVDQALLLLGPARAVTAWLHITQTPDGPVDTGFVLTIAHHSGAHSHISSTKLARLTSRELRLIGTDGSYRSDYSDVQYEAILAGTEPAAGRDRWGFETPDRWGTLATADGEKIVPSLQGDYTRLYDEFSAAVSSGGPGPVPAAQAVAVLEVLDAARRSATQEQTVPVP